MGKFDYFKFESGFTTFGIPVFVKQFPWCNDWCLVEAALKFGHWDIPEGKEGSAHLLEHLLFQGTRKYSTKEIIREQADRIVFLDTLDGSAGWERFSILGKLKHRHLERGFDVFRDLLFFPVLREADLVEEKRVVLAEMWENYICQANIESRRLMRKDFYGSHVMGRNADLAFGDEETVENISREDISELHKQYFHAGNLFFLFAGDISLKKAILLVEKFTTGIPFGPSRKVRSKPDSWLGPARQIRELSSREMMGGEFSGRAMVRISMFRMLPKNTNPYLNSVLVDIYHRLLDEKFRHEMQITYGVRVSLHERSDHDELEIWMEVDPEKYVSTRALMEEMVSQFGSHQGDERIFRETVSSGIKKSPIREFVSGNILNIATVDVINYGRIYSTKEMHQFKKKIAFQEIIDYVSKELSSDKLYWWVLTP
jgi:predicted Zn-dependent peptidase